jgi:hypothetical protein
LITIKLQEGKSILTFIEKFQGALDEVAILGLVVNNI